MLILCLLLFHFLKINKIKTKLSPINYCHWSTTTNQRRCHYTTIYRCLVVFKSMIGYRYWEIVLSFHQLASIHRIYQPMVYFGRLIKYIRKNNNFKWLCGYDFLVVFNINCVGYILWYYCLRNLGSCICF